MMLPTNIHQVAPPGKEAWTVPDRHKFEPLCLRDIQNFIRKASINNKFYGYDVRILLSHFPQSGKYPRDAVIQGRVLCNDNDLHLLQMERTFHEKGDHTVKIHKKSKPVSPL